MITKAILALIVIPFKAALSLLPTVSAPDVSGMVSAMAPVWQFAGWVNNYLPLAEAAVVLGILLTAFQAIVVVRAVLWVLAKLHILGGE
jgi:hypothetical protein